MTWAVRIITGLAAAGGAAWGYIAARERWTRAGKVIKDSQADLDARRHLAAIIPPPVTETRPGAGLFCLWCHPTTAGRAGRCGCTSRCEDVPHCIGDYTAIGSPEFTAQLERMLHEGGQYG